MKWVPLAWHHLRLAVPDTWELIGFNKNAEDGRLVLSDRHGETLQLFWRRFKETPQVRRRLIELVQTNSDPPPEEAAVRRDLRAVAGWDAYLPETAGPFFAGRYLENAILLAAVFPRHPKTERETVERVLKSWRPNDGAERLWAAFGMEFTLPSDLALASVDALPGVQRLRFETRRRASVTVHRYGMASLLLRKDDLAAFFARVKRRKLMLRREGEFTRPDGRVGVVLSYTTRGAGDSPFGALLARTWHGRAWLWRQDDLERILCAEAHSRRRDFLPDLPERVRAI